MCGEDDREGCEMDDETRRSLMGREKRREIDGSHEKTKLEAGSSPWKEGRAAWRRE